MHHPLPLPGKLDLAVVELNEGDRVDDLPLLEENDRLRYQRIRPAKRRRLFHFRRSVLQTLLGRLRKAPLVLRDEEGHVRAILCDGVAQYVSTSASGGVCAITICDRPVGIDVERADNPVDLVSLLDFVADLGLESLKSLPIEIAAFEARIAWTRLEAGLKRAAKGIHDHMVQKGDRSAAEAGSVHILATFDWVCTVVHAGAPMEMKRQFSDFRSLCHA